METYAIMCFMFLRSWLVNRCTTSF